MEHQSAKSHLGTRTHAESLQRVHRNHDIYQCIAMELEESEYFKTWQQHQTKLKKLTQKQAGIPHINYRSYTY